MDGISLQNRHFFHKDHFEKDIGHITLRSHKTTMEIITNKFSQYCSTMLRLNGQYWRQDLTFSAVASIIVNPISIDPDVNTSHIMHSLHSKIVLYLEAVLYASMSTRSKNTAAGLTICTPLALCNQICSYEANIHSWMKTSNAKTPKSKRQGMRSQNWWWTNSLEWDAHFWDLLTQYHTGEIHQLPLQEGKLPSDELQLPGYNQLPFSNPVLFMTGNFRMRDHFLGCKLLWCIVTVWSTCDVFHISFKYQE